MPVDYLPILVMAVVTVAFAAIAIIVPTLVGPRRPNKAQSEAYESGMLPYGTARRRYPVKYYLIAVLFILFDIEIIFLYPWAVNARGLGWYGLAAMGVFLLILIVGYLYEWRKGLLDEQ